MQSSVLQHLVDKQVFFRDITNIQNSIEEYSEVNGWSLLN